MKNLRIAILLCVFTMQAEAKYERLLKGPVGAAKFRASAKKYANSALTCIGTLESWRMKTLEGWVMTQKNLRITLVIVTRKIKIC